MLSLTGVKNLLNEVPNINYGGCGLSALAMYRWLKANNKLVGDESFVYLYTINDGTYNSNCEVLENKNKKKLGSASHIMLYHDGRVHDSISCEVKPRYKNQHKHLTEKHLVESLNYGYWNNAFYRGRYKDEIAKLFNIELNDVNEEFNN